MQIRVLGNLEASVDECPIALGGAKQRAVLAMLGLEANRTVTADRLSEGLWGEEPPPSAAKMIQNYVWRLRRVLADDGGAEILTRGRGYELRIDPEGVDVCRFERLVTEAARAAEAGRPGTRRARRSRCFAAIRCRIWPTSRSRGRRSAGSRSCGRRPRSWRSTRTWPPAAIRRSSGRSTRCWPRTRCASGCTGSGCSRSIGAGVRPRRSRRTGRAARARRARSASSRARSCSACTRRSCATTRRSTSTRGRASCRASSTPRRRRRCSVETVSCARLRVHWQRAAGGAGALVALVGAYGMGKTRLAAEIAATPTATARPSSTPPGRARPRPRWPRIARARECRGGRRCWCSTTPTARRTRCTPRARARPRARRAAAARRSPPARRPPRSRGSSRATRSRSSRSTRRRCA